MSDAERNVRGLVNVASIIRRPPGTTVSTNEHFVVCSKDGYIGIAQVTVDSTDGDVIGADVNWVEPKPGMPAAVCGDRLENLERASQLFGLLVPSIRRGDPIESLQKLLAVWEANNRRRQP